MKDADRRIREAEERLDAGDAAGARDDLRALAVEREPTATLLANLALAEAIGQRDFARGLSRAYSTSFTVRMNEAAVLGDRWPDLALNLYTELLEVFGESPERTFQIRMARLRAAVRRGRGDLLRDDFEATWRLTDQFEGAARSRPALCEILAATHRTELLPALRAMRDADWLPPLARTFLASQVAELVVLARIQEARKLLRPDPTG